ncbi:hypothetical protein [Caballeronia sp.]|uniref:hypothetical protein n=1 Tax=Caballeronia sp. TaxID=1931223 RepID=UPI003C6EB1AC
MSDKLLNVLHETAQGLHQAGTMDAVTLWEFDALCLPPAKDYSAAQIKRLRQRGKASQAVFATGLNTSIDGPETGAGPEATEWAVDEAARPG